MRHKPPATPTSEPTPACTAEYEVTYDITATVTERLRARTRSEAAALAQRFCAEVAREAHARGVAQRVELRSVEEVVPQHVVLPPSENTEALHVETTESTTIDCDVHADPNKLHDYLEKHPEAASRFAGSKVVYDA